MSTEEKLLPNLLSVFIPALLPYDIDRLTAYIEDGLEPDLIIYAIEEAAANNARRMSYIMKILDRFRAAGTRPVKLRGRKSGQKQQQLLTEAMIKCRITV